MAVGVRVSLVVLVPLALLVAVGSVQEAGWCAGMQMRANKFETALSKDYWLV